MKVALPSNSKFPMCKMAANIWNIHEHSSAENINTLEENETPREARGRFSYQGSQGHLDAIPPMIQAPYTYSFIHSTYDPGTLHLLVHPFHL